MFKQIKKRDGSVRVFKPEKITIALTKSGLSTGEFDEKIAAKLTEKVLEKAEKEIKVRMPGVEQIQDVVEQVLLESRYRATAKHYILYREERSRIRETKSNLMNTYRMIALASAKEDSDVKRGNANVNGDGAMGKMLQFGAEGSKEFTMNVLLRPEYAAAHRNGDIHIHDLDFWATGTMTCCQIDPLLLFKDGFNTGHGFLRPPNSIGSYAALAAIIIQANQNEQHGGQSIPNFDYAMAPGVNKTYRKSLKKNFIKYHAFTGKKMPNMPDFSKITFGDDKKLAKIGIPDKIVSEAKVDTENQTQQAMEGIIHNLNTMHSRAGAQIPFSSLNFGTDTSPEGRLVSRALLEAIWNGLGRGETPIFPISVFKVKEGINYNPKDPNYDLFKRAMEVSAKRLFPNFAFIDAPFNLQYYKKGDYNTEIAYMGCRTRVASSVFPESDGQTTRRGNCSFLTINLPRIAIKHGIARNGNIEADWSGFYKELDEKINLGADIMAERFDFQAAQHTYNFPFLMGQGVWFTSEKLEPGDVVREAAKHGTLSLGFHGLAEALVAMTGYHHGENEESAELGLDIIAHIRERLDALAKKRKLNYSLLATPAEGIAGRFTKIDRKEFGELKGVTDREFYTNSYHVPVYQPISAFDKIEKEAPYHALCNAGHITYVELDGDPLQNLDAFEAIIRKMKESGIGYGSINHPVDRDPVCGYSGIISEEICPACRRKEGDVPFERLRRITGYLAGSLERWNDAKKAEEKARVKHSVDGVYTRSQKEVREQIKKDTDKMLGKN